MKSLLAIVVSVWSALTLTSCIDLAPLQGGGGGGYGGGGYGGGYDRPGYSQPSYNSGGYRPAPHYDSHDHDHSSHSGSSSNYYGGPEAWYKSGYALGKRDRREHKSCNYRRYSNQYDGKTQSHFARGYEDGYH